MNNCSRAEESSPFENPDNHECMRSASNDSEILYSGAEGSFPLDASSSGTGYVTWTDLLMAAGDAERFSELVASRDAARRDPNRAQRIASERDRLMAELRLQESN
jgi:hypothetical protein